MLRVFVRICLVKVNTRKLPPLPIYVDGVIFLECVQQVVGVAFSNVFNPKVVDYESKNNWAPFGAP